jgi:hypothetical protein
MTNFTRRSHALTGMGFLVAIDGPASALASQAATGVQLLAHEDTALKAYHQTRARYLAGVPQRRAFNQIGEALPTVIINGRVAGTWSWDARTRSIRTRLIPGKATTAERSQVRARAATLTQALRLSWAPAQSSRRPPKDLNQPAAGTALR